MPEAYNPIVRTFCQFRAGLVDHFGIAREEIRPGTPLAAILPVAGRRDVWQQLRRRGLRLPDLELSGRDFWRSFLLVVKGIVSSAVHLGTWYTVALAVPFTWAVFRLTRRRAVHFPLGLRTVGELVIYATSFSDHRESGYRWTRNEIALKVRMIVAESVGLPLEAVQPETKLIDL